MHPFKKYIASFVSLNNTDWEEIEKCLTRNEHQTGDILLRQGKVCKKLYFLESGFLRFFVMDKNGEDVTKFFTEPPYCLTSQRSFTNETPSTDNIEVMEKSIVWEIKKEDAFALLKIPAWSEFVRKLIQEVQFYTEEILQELQNKTAEERYIALLEGNSIILQKAPLKYIASYLGIAPQSLSRIRKKYYLQSRS